MGSHNVICHPTQANTPRLNCMPVRLVLEIKKYVAFMSDLLCNYCVCCSMVDPYGFERHENFDARIHEEFMSDYLTVLARRARRWSRYMRGRKRVSKSAKCTTFAVIL